MERNIDTIRDTARLKGTLAKAKANAAQGIPRLIENATGKRYIGRYFSGNCYNQAIGS